MKGFLALCLTLFLPWLVSVADAQDRCPVSVGIKSGVALSTTSVDEYDMMVGFDGGAVVDYNFSRNLFVRTGLDFVMKGAKLDLYTGRMVGTVAEYSNKYSRVHTNYLQLPLMVGYRTPVSAGVFVYASAGFYGSYGVFGSGKYRYTTNVLPDRDENVDYDSFDDLRLKKFDWGIIGSIGVEYGRYSINVGYEYGFLNLNKTNGLTVPANFTNGDSWHTMNATCTLGYRLR